jgi:hypothetical protein
LELGNFHLTVKNERLMSIVGLLEVVTKNYLLQEIEFPTAGLESVPGSFHLPCDFTLSLFFFGFNIAPINLYCYITRMSGDGEGGIEMTGSMQLIREFCDRFISPEKATRTRIVSFLVWSSTIPPPPPPSPSNLPLGR